MNATQQLHDLGQSLWLDNITRDLLTRGTLRSYIDRFSVTGLTSNPTIFEKDIKNSSAYDTSIREMALSGKEAEAIFFDLAIEDIRQAADLFRPIYDRTDGVDGWVSIEVSPLLAHNTSTTVTATNELFLRAARPNVFIKIPGTSEGIRAIEEAEAIFAGIPVNVTLLFSPEHYLASAEAYRRGIDRRIDAGLNPNVPSVASVFISRWDVAVMDKVPDMLRNRLGIAIARRIYDAYNSQLDNERSRRIYNFGARPQRLLWASTGTKDPTASDILYVKALAVPFTVNTMPEETLKAFADHGKIDGTLTTDGDTAEVTLRQFSESGIDIDALAAQLQDDGTKSFAKSWKDLIDVISSKGTQLKKAS
jgi:transaldolase